MALTGIDVAALGIAANALPAAKAYTDSAIASLPAGVHLKGTVNYYADLPASPSDGDAYTVLYKGVSPSTEPDGTEYAWAASQNVWVALGADISGKADKVASAVAGDFAGLDANGNLVDSGKKAADFVWTGAQVLSSAEKEQARTNIGAGTYNKPSGGIPKTDMDSGVRSSLDNADRLPIVTGADNGKFNRVINGAWAAVAVQNANGVSF